MTAPGPVTYRQVIEGRLDQLDRVAKGEPRPMGLPTGFRLWDKNGGLKRKVIHLGCGDAGEGKSFVTTHIMEAAAKAGHRVDFLSLEDPGEETADRTLAKHAKMETHAIQGQVTASQVKTLKRAGDLPWADLINVYDDLDTAQDLIDILDSTDAELVLLDYLQLIPEGPGGLEETLRHLARAAQRWAKRAGPIGRDGKPLGGAILAQSQVTKEVSKAGLAWYQKNAGKGYPEAIRGYVPGPGKAHIAWCGAWGERAKSVTYYHRPGRWGRHHGFDVEDNRFHLIQGKSSFGREGTIIVGFDPAYGRLYDL